ncbi:MAG TPA: alpha/beta hydrolase [Propionibacteriaceae bacterium]|nr:alpha/beta hydrolase [Propionibacteriaceae bacterium]
MPDPGHGRTGTLRTVVIDGHPVAYWRRGPLREGRTLVMLHGLGGDHTGLLALAERLRGVQVVAPDLPGYGASPALPVKHTLHEYGRVVDGLRERLGLARFALLGHSFGADVALAYAHDHPDAVTDLCLLNPVVDTSGVASRLGVLFTRVSSVLPPSLARALLTNRAVAYLQDRPSLATRDRGTRRRILRQDYISLRKADPRAIHESARSLQEVPFDRYARTVRARTLVLTGSRDRIARPGALARVHWPRPTTRVTVAPGAGHLLPVEQPGLASAHVNRFLDSSRRR